MTATLPTAGPPPAEVQLNKKAFAKERLQKRTGWLMLLPALLHSSIFLAIPVLMAVGLSFTDYEFEGAPNFLGFDNYAELFQDDRFLAALKNTLIYTVAVVPFAMGIALLIAIGLNQNIRGRSFFRTVYYLPVVTATVAAGSVWLWIYNPSGGLANHVLSLFGLGPSPFLNSASTALPSVIVVGIWQGLGAKMIVYLAALQNVRKDLLEAAALDGANRWQVFRTVVWPALGPANFFVLVTAIVQSTSVFDLIFVMTHGGPGNATTMLTYDIYTNAFQGLRLGYASAESVVLILLIALFIYLGQRAQRNDAGD
jgi:multiple sugar transport system permease protein